jgi:hypothetical protein
VIEKRRLPSIDNVLYLQSDGSSRSPGRASEFKVRVLSFGSLPFPAERGWEGRSRSEPHLDRRLIAGAEHGRLGTRGLLLEARRPRGDRPTTRAARAQNPTQSHEPRSEVEELLTSFHFHDDMSPCRSRSDGDDDDETSPTRTNLLCLK